MLGDALVRFAIGGAMVSIFAVIGECLKPKTFSGLFGAAPSVAVATAVLAFIHDGSATVRIDARWMAYACVALLAYSSVCIVVCRQRTVPVWLGAAAAWVIWIAIALALHGALA